MYNRELTAEIFRNIIWAIEQITKRFQAIETSEDFIKDEPFMFFLSDNIMLGNLPEMIEEFNRWH